MYYWLLGMNICVLFDYFKVYTMLIALKNTVWFIVSATSLQFLSKMSRWTAKSAGSFPGAEAILFVNIGQIVKNVKISDLEEVLKRESFSKVRWKVPTENSMINIRKARLVDSMNDILYRFSHGDM